MLSLTFYGGVNEIGGNKVLLEEGDARLFFDFGFPFARRSLFFEEYLKPRSGRGLLDLLELGLLPPLEGIYREDLAPPDLWSHFRSTPAWRELEVEAVLLSHAHLDHSGYISFLKPDIPVHATAMTAFIARAIQDGASDFEKEVCFYSPRKPSPAGYLSTKGEDYRQRPFCFVDTPSLSPEAKEFWEASPARTKKLETCSWDKGSSLPLRHFPVDHSIFGAAAFAVETSPGWVGYTGDLRLHGKRGALTQRFLEEMHSLRPYILLCEGTRAGEERQVSEEEVYHNAHRVCHQSRGLVIADFGPRNVERLHTFHRIAQETSRSLVILAKDAHLLKAMSLVSTEVSPPEALPSLSLYDEPKEIRKKWEEAVRRKVPLAKAREIGTHPGDYILCFSFWDVGDLVDIKPRGGVYLYSSSEAYDEEQRLDLQRLHHWIEHFGMEAVGLPRPNREGDWEIPPEEQGLHSSGHASGPELLRLIRSIAPQILVPIHTVNPDYFAVLREDGIEVCPPMQNGWIFRPGEAKR